MILLRPLLILLLIAGCSSNNKMVAPPQGAGYRALQDSEKARYWQQTYLSALRVKESEPEKACKSFQKLSKEENFPLKLLAHYRAVSACAASGISLMIPENPPKGWLEDAHLHARLAHTQAFGSADELAPLLVEKSKLTLPMHEKVELVETAIQLSSDAKLQKQFQARIEQLSPSLIKKPRPSDWLSIAKDYTRQRQFKKARKYYKKIIHRKRSKISEKIQAQNDLAKTWKLVGNHPRYLRELKQLQDIARPLLIRGGRQNVETYHDISIRVARRYWTLGQVTNAKKELKKLEKAIAGKRTPATIYWLYGRMAEERQEFDMAIHHFDKAIERTSSKSIRLVYLWYRAWNLRKTGNHTEALADFSTIMKESEDFDSRVAYWHARTLAQVGEDATPAYERLAKEDPFGYYGLLAYRELDRPMPPITANIDQLPAPQIADKYLITMDWLIAVGETEMSRHYIEHIKQQNPGLPKLDQLELWARSGIYLPLFREISRMEAEQKHALIGEYPQLLFPRPYYSMVKKAAEHFEVDEALIYSIMRQESAFNATARSHADAFGLMQILEPIAKHHARRNQRSIASFIDLYDPETNIFLGAALLRSLFDKQGGFIPAVASYNANQKALRTWIATRFNGDTTEFIEDVPYEETQKYLKLVLRNYAFYQRLTNLNAPTPFPHWTLENVGPFKSASNTH